MKKRILSSRQTLFFYAALATCLTIFASFSILKTTSRIETFTSHISRIPAAATKACVLYYERTEHPSWSQLKNVFKDQKEAVLVPVSKPTDIVRCVMDHNPQEILIVAPSSEVDSETAKIVFFYPLTEDESRKNYKTALSKVRQSHKKILRRKDFTPCKSIPQDATTCSEIQKQELKLRSRSYKLAHLKQSDPLYKMTFGYQKGLLSPKLFEDLYQLVKTSNLNLKKISLMSHKPKKIFNAYPGLQKMVLEQRIKLGTYLPAKSAQRR